MLFNEKKCKVLHVGISNTKFAYSIKSLTIEKVEIEKDLGVMISSDLKTLSQCNYACSKANKMLGLVKRAIKSRSMDIMLLLFKSLVRPHVEYCSSVWFPYFKKDKNQTERIQHGFTRLFPDLIDKPYEDRLAVLDL